jgi:tripartite-type tricarboxylate transporter receptor subunit TctC
MMKRFVRLLTLVAMPVCIYNPLLAQGFPSKPIRLIVPVTPGGGTDVAARIITRVLGEGLGVQVVADNRGGASGARRLYPADGRRDAARDDSEFRS